MWSDFFAWKHWRYESVICQGRSERETTKTFGNILSLKPNICIKDVSQTEFENLSGPMVIATVERFQW